MKKLWIAALGVLFVSTGCGAGDESGDGTAGTSGTGDPVYDPIATVTQPVDGSWATKHTWTASDGTYKPLQPASTHVCVLTKMQGKFDRNFQRISLNSGYVDDPWYFDAGPTTPPQNVWAEAWCFAKNAFLANGPDRVHSQDPFWVDNSTSSGFSSATTQTWWGDAVTFLNGVWGNFRGYGEKLYVTQSMHPFTSSSLTRESFQSGVGGYAFSYYVGTGGSGVPVKFWGGEYVADTINAGSDGSHGVIMAPTGDAMCYLTTVAGKFDGSAEYVKISPVMYNGIEHWELRAKGALVCSGCSVKYKPVRGKARCMKRNQR